MDRELILNRPRIHEKNEYRDWQLDGGISETIGCGLVIVIAMIRVVIFMG